LASSRLSATPPFGRAPARAYLFDHLVSPQQNRWGYGKTERLGRLGVHSHLEFDRQFNWQVRRLCSAQDAIYVGSGATK
jgi:hypothetical protein